MALSHLKIVLVGDTKQLIHEAILSFAKEVGPDATAEAGLCSVKIIHHGKPYQIGIWYVPPHAGPEADRLRPLTYPRTDLFGMIYSPQDVKSFESLSMVFNPELNHHMPGTPKVIISLTKNDAGDPVVSLEQGKELARQIETAGFMDVNCSTINEAWAHEILDILLESWSKSNRASKQKQNRCVIS